VSVPFCLPTTGTEGTKTSVVEERIKVFQSATD
jgi:hypothetical protein